jgi:hypothetical protein
MSDPDSLLGPVTDRDLADCYWQARAELARLRTAERPAAPRVRGLEALCERLWRESQRRTQAGSIAGAA